MRYKTAAYTSQLRRPFSYHTEGRPLNHARSRPSIAEVFAERYWLDARGSGSSALQRGAGLVGVAPIGPDGYGASMAGRRTSAGTLEVP